MKLSKTLASITLVAASTLLLAACSGNNSAKKESSSEATSSSAAKTSSSTAESKEQTKVAGGDLKDGTYKLEEKNYSNDYRVVFSIDVAGNKITKVNYDYVNKDGKSKKVDAEYNKSMEAKSGTSPEKFIPALNEALEKNGVQVSNIEVVSGATHSSEAFLNYAQQLIQAAQAGDTKTIEIVNGDDAKMKDGTYTLEEKNYSNGYRTTFAITVKDNKITESTYDNINKEGKSKADDAEYNKSMKKVSGSDPETYIPKLNEELVKSSDPLGVEVVSGATHSSHSFVLYAQQLVNAAQKGDTAKIEVDNYVFEDK